jgi:hypothetical protein
LAVATAKFMTDGFWWFYLVGTPYFFADRFGLSLKSRSGPIAAIYICASVGSVGGGWLSGHFMKMGWTTNKARKVTLLICSLCVLPVVGATLVETAFNTGDAFFAKLQTTTYTVEQTVKTAGVDKIVNVKTNVPEATQTALQALRGQSFVSAADFRGAASKLIPEPEFKAMSDTLVECARSNNNYWWAVVLIALAASAHQAWSANVFSLAGDMFPRRVVGSVTGLGGFAGSVGAIILFFIVGELRDAAIKRGEPGNYFLIFLAASVGYATAVLLIHLLVPKLEPANIDQKTSV